MIGHFPLPYPDELLYSMCARFSTRMGYSSKQAVVKDLFGRVNVVAAVSLPGHLEELVANLPPGYPGSLNRFIDEHTLLPYYGPFQPVERLQQLRADMAGNYGPVIHRRAGLNSSRIAAPARLRYCRQCVEQDRQKWGEGYWHRLHQVPGVELCPDHQLWLNQSSVAVQASVKSKWYEFISLEQALATEPAPAQSAALARNETGSSDLEPHPDPHPLEKWRSWCVQLAQDTRWLLDQSGLAPGLRELRQRYLTRLIDSDLATYTGVVRIDRLRAAFANHYCSEFLAELHCELNSGSPRMNWLTRLVQAPDTAQHPLYHLLLMQFLGLSAAEFFSLPLERRPFGRGPWACLNPVGGHYRELKVRECTISYKKVRGAHPPVGTFGCQECGYIYLREGPDKSPEDSFRISRMVSFGRVWEARLGELWHDPTINSREIGPLLGVCWVTVKYRAGQLGLPFPKPGLRKKPAKSEAGIRAGGEGKNWEEQLKELWQDPSISVKEKARQLGVGWFTITDRAAQLGLSFPPAGIGKKPPNRLMPQWQQPREEEVIL